MINLISGGHWSEKGYCYSIYMIIPSFTINKTISIDSSEHKSIKLSFPSKIVLTTNSLYFNMVCSILGFGFGLEIQSKS